MKESFVFHSDFIEDLPEGYKARFAMYAINYGLSGEEPSLEGLELALWLKIQRRINSDQEAWEEAKNARSTAGKLGGIKSGINRSKTKQIEANEAMLHNNEANEAMLNLLPENEAKGSDAKQEQANEAVNVYESISVICDDVNVSRESDSNTDTITQKILDIQKKYNLNLTKNQIRLINSSLKTSNLDASFLDYVVNYLLETYHKVDSGLFYNGALTWDNLRTSFSSAKPKKNKIPDFEKCPDCGGSLTWISAVSRFCGNCRKDYAYSSKKWSVV